MRNNKVLYIKSSFKLFVNSLLNKPKIKADKDLEKYSVKSPISLHVTDSNKIIKFLVFSDLHHFEHSDLPIDSEIICNLDFIIVLGDISRNSLMTICKYYRNIKIYGILGNHDLLDNFNGLDIINIHNNLIELNKNGEKFKFVGFQGAFKYKEEYSYPLYSQNESIIVSESLNKSVDILFSHDSPYKLYRKNWVHCGLMGINNYLDTNKAFINIHGHHHINEVHTENGKAIISVYGIVCIKIDLEGHNFDINVINE